MIISCQFLIKKSIIWHNLKRQHIFNLKKMIIWCQFSIKKQKDLIQKSDERSVWISRLPFGLGGWNFGYRHLLANEYQLQSLSTGFCCKNWRYSYLVVAPLIFHSSSSYSQDVDILAFRNFLQSFSSLGWLEPELQLLAVATALAL